jgi:hypothetical protein
MLLKASRAIFIILFISFSYSITSGYDLKTRYTTITYENEEQLRKFNKEFSLGSLSYLIKNRQSITVNEEIANKTDALIEKVETILEMFPKEIKFTIVLLNSDNEVQRIYRSKYGTNVDYIAFYSPRDKTVFVSVDDVELDVLAHEFSHVIIDFYYSTRTPVKIHELLSQYVEEHLRD